MIKEKQQLARDSYEELWQLRAFTDVAIQKKHRVLQHLLATIPGLATPNAVPQPTPAPAQVPVPFGQSALPPAGAGLHWDNFS